MPVGATIGARNAWFDYRYMLAVSRGLLDEFLQFSTCLGGLGILRSILVVSPACVALRKWPRSSSIMAVACVFPGFAGFFAPRAVFPTIAGRSKFLLMSSCTWKSVHYLYEPPCIFSICHSRFFALVDFLGPSSTHSCECSRAGGAGVAGSFLPGDSAPGFCQLVTMVLWTYTLS